MPLSPAILDVYRRSDVQMARGEGVYLFDETGKRYLDFSSGVAVNALGHSHPALVAALQDQAAKLWHCSNLFHTTLLVEYSEALVAQSFADRVFFCNSGAEAVETAIKIIRRYHDHQGNPGRYRLSVSQDGFHGRTLAATSAGSNPRVREGYAPLVEGFDVVPFNDVAALHASITPETAGIMLEPVQGEGGARPHSAEYIQAARQICDEQGLVLFFDEVQCGMGRPGTLFAYERYSVEPDICSIGKGIGNGFPLAATLMRENIAQAMTPGSHGSTYGSNPLALRVGLKTLRLLTAPGFLEHARQQGEVLRGMLENLQQRHSDKLEDVRGLGLLLGLKTTVSAYTLSDALRDAGLLTAPAGDGLLRILPPLIITQAHCDEALAILDKVLSA